MDFFRRSELVCVEREQVERLSKSPRGSNPRLVALSRLETHYRFGRQFLRSRFKKAVKHKMIFFPEPELELKRRLRFTYAVR